MPLADRLVARWPVANGELSPTLSAVVHAIIFGLAIATFKLGVFAMTRALMGLIVLNVAFEHGFLPPSMFAMLVVWRW
jgi:hypothetical protein